MSYQQALEDFAMAYLGQGQKDNMVPGSLKVAVEVENGRCLGSYWGHDDAEIHVRITWDLIAADDTVPRRFGIDPYKGRQYIEYYSEVAFLKDLLGE